MKRLFVQYHIKLYISTRPNYLLVIIILLYKINIYFIQTFLMHIEIIRGIDTILFCLWIGAFTTIFLTMRLWRFVWNRMFFTMWFFYKVFSALPFTNNAKIKLTVILKKLTVIFNCWYYLKTWPWIGTFIILLLAF